MNITVMDSDDTKMKLYVEGATYALMNSLRRSVMYHVPTLAIEDVTIIENTTIFDEALAHRLGLIPWRYETDAIDEEEGATLTLKREEPGTIYARDIETPEGVEAMNPDTPITILKEQQRVELEAVAKLGYGYQHAKWQAAIASYMNAPEITVTGNKKAKTIVEEMPGNLVMVDQDGELQLHDNADPATFQRIEDLSDGQLQVKQNPDAFIFTIESVSGLTPKEILLKGIESLEHRVDEFQEQIQ